MSQKKKKITLIFILKAFNIKQTLLHGLDISQDTRHLHEIEMLSTLGDAFDVIVSRYIDI